MRIRKRSAGRSSVNPEPHDSSSGGPHLLATPNSHPSSHFAATCSLSSPACIIKQDHSLLPAISGDGDPHRSSQKQAPAEAVAFKRKPCTYVSAGGEFWRDNKAVKMPKEDKSPTEERTKGVQQNDMKHMHGHGANDDITQGMLYMTCGQEIGLVGQRSEEKIISEEYKKAKDGHACKGSGLLQDGHVHADLTAVDATECPRKVRPPQLFLTSDHNSPTTPGLRPPLCPPSSSNINMPCTPPPLPRKADRSSSCVPVRTRPLISSAGRTSTKQLGAEVTSRDVSILFRNEDSSSCSSERPLANVGTNQIELKSCQPLCANNIFNWQGHRRQRTPRHGARGQPGFAALGASSVNTVSTEDSAQKNGPSDQKAPRKKAKPIKRKPLDTLGSPQLVAALPGSAELREKCLAADNNAHAKNDPLFLSPSATCDIPTRMIQSVHVAGSPDSTKLAVATATHTNDEHVLSSRPAAALDQVSQHDSNIRCRRKDGRRWRCKAPVVSAGAPFCLYHTLRMREKRAARKLSKQLDGEVRYSMPPTDFTCSSRKRTNKTGRVSSPPSIKVAHESCNVAAVDNEDESKAGEPEDDVEEENKSEDEQQKLHAEITEKKQVQQASTALKRRCRKKRKPQIRRLDDIHDRARPAGTYVLNPLSPYKEDAFYPENHPQPVRACVPLPPCLLNTDPYEWRSDFPF